MRDLPCIDIRLNSSTRSDLSDLPDKPSTVLSSTHRLRERRQLDSGVEYLQRHRLTTPGGRCQVPPISMRHTLSSTRCFLSSANWAQMCFAPASQRAASMS